MKKLYSILLFSFCVMYATAQNGQGFSLDQIIKTAPSPAKLVNDYAAVLTAEQQEALEQKLYKFDDSTTSQIVVVIVNSLEGRDVADVAIELGRSWGVGDKKNNNGVVLLISKADRKLNISPGYGLEKSLPDLVCQQIIQTIIVPNFKGNDYYGGIDRGTDAMIQAIKGEFKAPAGYNKKGKKGSPFSTIIFIMVVIIVIVSMLGGGGRGGGGNLLSGGGAMPFILGSLLGSAGRGGGFGGGGGGSSGGGGFGGFGGGSFGGGGSSGDW
jgi:uncharacterized protein